MPWLDIAVFSNLPQRLPCGGELGFEGGDALLSFGNVLAAFFRKILLSKFICSGFGLKFGDALLLPVSDIYQTVWTPMRSTLWIICMYSVTSALRALLAHTLLPFLCGRCFLKILAAS